MGPFKRPRRCFLLAMARPQPLPLLLVDRWRRSAARWVRLDKTRVPMPRSTRTITFSLSPDLMERVDEVTRSEGRSRSELLREAVLRYLEEREWRSILDYGEQRAREQGLGPEDVALLIDEYRSEAASPRS